MNILPCLAEVCTNPLRLGTMLYISQPWDSGGESLQLFLLLMDGAVFFHLEKHSFSIFSLCRGFLLILLLEFISLGSLKTSCLFSGICWRQTLPTSYQVSIG